MKPKLENLTWIREAVVERMGTRFWFEATYRRDEDKGDPKLLGMITIKSQ